MRHALSSRDVSEKTAVQRLRYKLARDAEQRAKDRYFGLTIAPVLVLWALVIAGGSAAAGALIPLGVSLTVYFGGAAILVIWLERRARRVSAER